MCYHAETPQHHVNTMDFSTKTHGEHMMVNTWWSTHDQHMVNTYIGFKLNGVKCALESFDCLSIPRH